MSKDISPEARQDGLVTSKVGDETVVYDTEKNIASCLNELTTAVWEACDGNTGVPSILDTVRNAGYQDATEQIVLMAIEELDQAGLLEEASGLNEEKRKSMNRREILRVVGKSAAILPVVSTIFVSPSIAAGSLGLGQPCNKNSQCATNCCTPGGVCAAPDPTNPNGNGCRGGN